MLLLLLLLSATLTVLPIAPAFGSTGHPTLGVTNTDATQPTTYTAGASYVNVTAGSDSATTDGSTAGYLAIDFGTFGGTQLVTFSGTQFFLYLSQDGFSQISASDIKYTGPSPFFLSDLLSAGWHAITESNGTFYIGQTTSGQEVVTGPIPIRVSNAYKYIKIFDGSTTAVAVSTQYVNIQPGLTLTPTSGPAGTTVMAIGGGFPSSEVIDLVYSYVFSPWNGVATPLTGNWTVGINTGSGNFTYTAPMIDSKQAFNPNSGLRPISYINIAARYKASPHDYLASATFNENTRVFTGVKSYDSGGGALDLTNAPPGPYGNDSSGAGHNLDQPISADVLGTINIAGDQFMANSPVTFWVGATLVGSTTANGAGHFDATIAVPVLPAGTARVKVVNNGVTYEFSIEILPTLVLTPSSGPVGTHVEVTAYGFPASTQWFVYWHEHSVGDATWYQVAHGTTGATGMFTADVAFNVPNSYGGSHLVSASTTNVATSSPDSPGTTEAYTTSTVGTTTTTSSTSTSVTVSTTTTTMTAQPTTITQTTTQTQTTMQPTTTTETQTATQPTTVTQSTTQMQTTTQPMTTTMTTTTSLSSSGPFGYATLGAAVVVILAVAALAAWVLRRRRP
jgi:hypothetical protein